MLPGAEAYLFYKEGESFVQKDERKRLYGKQSGIIGQHEDHQKEKMIDNRQVSCLGLHGVEIVVTRALRASLPS